MHVLSQPTAIEPGELLKLMVTLPVATSLPQLRDAAAAAGVDEHALAEALVAAQEQGTVGIWSDPEWGPLVHLTSLASARLGLRLDDDSQHWVPQGDDRPRRQVRGRASRAERVQEANDTILGGLPAPPGPEYSERQAYSVDDLPEAYTVYGLGVTFPVPGMPTVVPARDGHDEDAPLAALPIACPGCQGRRLNLHDCCVICDRSGFDRLIGLSKLGRVKAGRTRYAPAKLKGGTA